MRTFLSDPSIPIKGLDSIEEYMQYYNESPFHIDAPMQEMASVSALLKTRLENHKSTQKNLKIDEPLISKEVQ